MSALTLLFEIMQGCQMGCKSCRIRKDSTSIPDDSTLKRLLDLLLDLRQHGTALLEIEIGPSDIFSANNRDEIFKHPGLKTLVNHFQTVLVNASFIYPDTDRYVWLAKQLQQYKNYVWSGLIIPIELEHVFNEKYLNRVLTNLQAFYGERETKPYRTVLNIIFDERYMSNPLNQFSYEALFQKTNGFTTDSRFTQYNVRVDFVFHHGREDLSLPWITEGFKEALSSLNHHYLLDHQENDREMVDGLPRFMVFDEENDELIYHDESLYIRPIMNDRVNILHERFRYQGKWRADALTTHLTERFNANLEQALSHPACGDCGLIAQCARRFTPDVMSLLAFEDCLPGRKDYEKH